MRVFSYIGSVLVTALMLQASDQPLDGIWQSQGWGFVYEIRGQHLQAFEVTAATWVKGFTAERISSDSAETTATFRDWNGNSMRISTEGDRNRRRIVPQDPSG